jgi:ABC-type antimicrobial peptide transport system permease subunit
MLVLEDMQLFSLGILFFHLIFDIVEMIFILISVLLIYSLLLIRLESKTLETGIMRMVGLSKSGIVLMIFLQCVMFVLPAIILGFILCFPSLALAYSYIFNASASMAFPPVPTWWAVCIAIMVGLLIPFLSSIIPIMRVLN